MMTLDEAIEHAKEVARTCDDSQCAADHMQLAEWLRELKRLRTENYKLRESVRNLLLCIKHEECGEGCPNYEPMYTDYGCEKNGSTVVGSEYLGCCSVGLENCNSMFFDADEYLRELGIEVQK